MASRYSESFTIEGRFGNNAFSYDRRGPAPSLWVPSLIDGGLDDVVPGESVVFEDVDEHDVLQSCRGLAHLVRTTWRGVPTVIVDNHNHAFYFWAEAIEHRLLQSKATVIHIDQHRDTRVPDQPYAGASLDDAFRYANFGLNVGNYIHPAQGAGIVGETMFVTGNSALRDERLVGAGNKIVNLDLDFFAPEMTVDFSAARTFIDAHLATASLVTIATSPFFIDQVLAIDVLRRLW